MRTTNEFIDTLIKQIDEHLLLSITCELIKAYEGTNLPVPIRKTYLSFSAEENKVQFFTDENGTKTETNDITVRINSFVPLNLSPSIGHTLAEMVSAFLCSSNEGITGFTVGGTEYDSDVDAYKITTRIYYSTTEEVKSATA